MSTKLYKEVVDKLVTLVTAGFGFVAALAWNEAIKSLFAEGGILSFISVYGRWVYALFVTLMAVVITILVTRASGKIK